MSRVEEKLKYRRKRRQLLLILTLIFVFLIMGVLSVDYALREMMALDEAKVLGYDVQENYTVLYVVGESIYIKNESIDKVTLFIEEGYHKILQQFHRLMEGIGNVGIPRHFFSNTTQNNYQRQK
ncbi:hypothetical protein [Clostridium formicaceticum]|uniref:Uncharacterized protein n=1 Tax=Clostridium formicaceticum TaxID=1497 RepID=A0AAC9RLE9_9CLOT|nr:hypothetical protein [Clostridium formicaceticum]AOY77573.1 hypothetical protein BJL90_17960 [Clostridium formicaceticum]ARE88151.1 hypothetical protein CLFO_25520 [Clostridium formicaceticum]